MLRPVMQISLRNDGIVDAAAKAFRQLVCAEFDLKWDLQELRVRIATRRPTCYFLVSASVVVWIYARDWRSTVRLARGHFCRCAG